MSARDYKTSFGEVAFQLIKSHVPIVHVVYPPLLNTAPRRESCIKPCVALPRAIFGFSQLLIVAFIASAAPLLAAVPNAIAIDAPAPLQALLRANLTLPEPDEMITDGVVNLPRAAAAQAAELTATEGYFSATFKLLRDGEPGKSSGLRLVVDAGPRSVIGTVEIIFSGEIATLYPSRDSADRHQAKQGRMKQLRDDWLLAKGNPFRQADWSTAKRELLQNLFAEDYPTAVITDSLADVDAENATVSIRVELNSGPAYTLGAVVIEGLKTYDRNLIDRYNQLYVGEPYSQRRLLDLQRALQNTPYFSSVLVDIDLDSTFDPTLPKAVNEASPPTPEPTGAPILAPVRIRVTEAKPKRISVSAGFSTNSGARGELIYRDANIFNAGWLLSVGLRADRIGQLGYADINLPQTLRGYRDSFGVLAERSSNQGLVTRREGVGVVRVQNRGIVETRLSLNFQREQRDVDQSALVNATPVNNAPRDALALNYSWTWRNVDNVLDPRSGQVINAQIGGAAKALLSDQNFVRGIFKIQQYWTVAKKDLFTVRFEGGITVAESRVGVPEEFLFRAGGAQSVRGYGYQSIGVSEGNATVGGRYLVAGMAEYVHWLGAAPSPQWGVAVFYDVGRAGDEPKGLFPLLSGVGAGARWRSPAGPLALDLAYSVRDRKVRPVFSISIAF